MERVSQLSFLTQGCLQDEGLYGFSVTFFGLLTTRERKMMRMVENDCL